MKRSRLSLIFWLPFIAFIGLLIILVVVFPLGIPKYAARIYGPAADSLPLKDRIYLSTAVILQKNDLTRPQNQFGIDVAFQVDLGESPLSISNRLKDVGLINNPDAFRKYIIYSGIDTQIQAGEFTLNSLMAPVDIARALTDPTPKSIEFAILEGWRVEEIAASLSSYGLKITPKEFITTVQSKEAEGYLFPGLYTIPRIATADLMVYAFTNAFNSNLTDEIVAGFTEIGLSIHEGVTLASIIEREAMIDEEMPMIASVFLNRLLIGMKLDADSTAQYALGYNSAQGTWWTNPLSLEDLKIESPFNTYLYPGLPPGPICNPGLNALRSVAFPAQTPYYYFRATCDSSGRHFFAETFEEHAANVCP